MAKTPEVKAKDAIKARIKLRCEELGLVAELDWHAGTEELRTVDATGVISGHPVAIEVKRFDGRNRATDLQKMKLQKFMDAGAATFLIDSEVALAQFDLWLCTLKPRSSGLPFQLPWV